MSMDNLMKGLMQSANQSQGQSSQQASSGGLLSDALGGLMGGGGGGNQADQLLGELEHITGGKPGSGQPLPRNGGNIPVTGAASSSPAMKLLQPVVGKVASEAHISPAMATIVAAIAMHYVLASHSSTSQSSPLNFKSVMQQLSSGGVSPDTLQNSGMVNDVQEATGLDQQESQSALETAFKAFASHI